MTFEELVGSLDEKSASELSGIRNWILSEARPFCSWLTFDGDNQCPQCHSRTVYDEICPGNDKVCRHCGYDGTPKTERIKYPRPGESVDERNYRLGILADSPKNEKERLRFLQHGGRIVRGPQREIFYVEGNQKPKTVTISLLTANTNKHGYGVDILMNDVRKKMRGLDLPEDVASSVSDFIKQEVTDQLGKPVEPEQAVFDDAIRQMLERGQ